MEKLTDDQLLWLISALVWNTDPEKSCVDNMEAIGNLISRHRVDIAEHVYKQMCTQLDQIYKELDKLNT